MSKPQKHQNFIIYGTTKPRYRLDPPPHPEAGKRRRAIEQIQEDRDLKARTISVFDEVRA